MAIERKAPDTIALNDWLTYLSQNSSLSPTPPREGINPFTKKPTTFKPAAGSAFFDTASGRCSVGYEQGTLVANVPGREAIPVLEQIAAYFAASIREMPD